MSEDQKDKYPHEGEPRPTFEGTRFDDHDLQKVHSQLMREKEEPTEDFSPMPLLFVAMFMMLAFWAGIYLVWYSGEFSAFQYDETKVAGSGGDAGPREVDMMALGKRVYSQNCVACHQATGLGTPGVYPPLVGSDWVKDNPERLVKVLLSGLSGKVTVNGEQFENAMTPFKKLKDQQIAAVLTFIRTNPDYQNGSHEVSEEMVKEVRAAYGERQDTWSQAELEAIHGPVTGVWVPSAVPVVEEPAVEGTEVEAATEEPVPAEA
jgi:mono/diheme cytochrome c family protein